MVTWSSAIDCVYNCLHFIDTIYLLSMAIFCTFAYLGRTNGNAGMRPGRYRGHASEWCNQEGSPNARTFNPFTGRLISRGRCSRIGPFYFLTMNTQSQYVSTECSTRVYYILTTTFRRPIEFKLCCTYNGRIKAQTAFEAAYWPVKVLEFIEPKEGMSFMESVELFDEHGKVIKQSHKA